MIIFVKDIIKCDFINNLDQLQKGMSYLRLTHTIPISTEMRVFDNVIEGKKLMAIACATKGNLFNEFKDLLEKIDIVDNYIKLERKKYNINMVTSHNDVYEPNFIATKDGDLYLIDWEYAGMQDPHVDLAMFCIYSMYDREQTDRLIDIYFEGNTQEDVRTKIYCYIAVCGLLWSNWCEYKSIQGVEFGEYSLAQYRYAKEYYRIVEERENEKR